jgi:DNA repair exonuclease SbcCD nuclease subunit
LSVPPSLRVLFVSDTHLGIDMPSRPRVERRRRGEDFFDVFEKALEPAFTGETDILVHGGDLFYRSRIPAWLAERVFSRLAAVADRGVDVYWVPGNHERSSVPRGLLLTHPGIHVFETPRTYVVERRGLRLALGGFPFASDVRTSFPRLLEESRLLTTPADARLLCLHQAVEGARVGPADFTFRDGDDVVRGADIPSGVAAVLVGHIHRHQVLTRTLSGRPLRAPVLYPGSIERTSFAEKGEPKGFLVVEVSGAAGEGGGSARWEFRGLPARPMVDLELPADLPATDLDRRLRESLARLAPDSVVRVRIEGGGEPAPHVLSALGAPALRAVAPPTMNVTFDFRRARSPSPEV